MYRAVTKDFGFSKNQIILAVRFHIVERNLQHTQSAHCRKKGPGFANKDYDRKISCNCHQKSTDIGTILNYCSRAP